MRYQRTLFSAVILIVTGSTQANEACIESASEYYNIPPDIIRAIGKVESNQNPYRIGDNGHSVGYMMINDYWWPTLRQYGVEKKDLFHACTNIYWGTWILAQEIQRHGLTWKAIGAYNAVSLEKQKVYAWKIYRAMTRSTR